MKQNLYPFLLFWAFIGLIGLELSLVSFALDSNLATIIYSFLLVFPFIFGSECLSFYLNLQLPTWAVKYQGHKHKIQSLTITCYILIALLGLLPIIITMIVLGVSEVTLMSNGNMGPFNVIGLVVFYLVYKLTNMGFLIVKYHPRRPTKKDLPPTKE